MKIFNKVNIKCTKRQFAVRVVLLIVLLFLFLKLAEFVLSKIVIAAGGSVPYHVFLREEFRCDDVEAYSYVLVRTPPEDRFAKGRLIVKQVTCLPHDYLKIVGLDYYCCKNEARGFEECIYLGKAKTRSMMREPVDPYNPCGRDLCVVEIPEGYLFLINQHKDSYDSRYLGPIPCNWVVAKVRPIF